MKTLERLKKMIVQRKRKGKEQQIKQRLNKIHLQRIDLRENVHKPVEEYMRSMKIPAEYDEKRAREELVIKLMTDFDFESSAAVMETVWKNSDEQKEDEGVDEESIGWKELLRKKPGML